MRKEVRAAVYDDRLRMVAYRLEGIARPFPNHFHEYYAMGFMEDGERVLSCNNREYTIAKGDVLLFNPGDSHACVQRGGGTLHYRGFTIAREVMLDLAEEVAGSRELPGFSQNVIHDEEAACRLRSLHELVMKGSGEWGREENLLRLISLLVRRYGQSLESCVPACREEIEKACAFIERHYAVQLPGECTNRQGQKAVGAGGPPSRGGAADRLLRSEPLHQLLGPIDWTGPRYLSGYIQGYGENAAGRVTPVMVDILRKEAKQHGLAK